ncbi:MAG: TlpA family protein disulfide reductase [Chloroflexi bacterium]|nr:TlpA family protein disulfide reductase [Chloroflexota bacterium]
MQPIQRRALYVILLLAGLAWIFLSADKTGASTAGGIPAPQKGFLAPEISLSTPKGEKYTLSELKGKAVLVNLWATWCPPCRAEMPTIEKIYEEYKDKGLVVLGVDTTSQDNPLDIAPFLTQYGITFPILLDEVGSVAQKYDLRSLPSSFFISRDGTINEVVIGGPMSEALLRTRVEEILK